MTIRRLPDDLTEPVREVLSMMVWETGRLAHAYRAAGHAIAPKAEAEQAFILHRLLGFALEHGKDWRKAAGADLSATIARAREIEAATKDAAP